MHSRDAAWVRINLAQQSLELLNGQRVVRTWPVSTARNGPGERADSGCTPRGEHRVRILIGRDCAPGTVFVGRRPTGELYSAALAAQHPKRDWILSRIIWLSGCERGVNRGPDCDTLRRFIYIHGCPDTEPMGTPLSHGCVRMRNADVIALFALIDTGTRVVIIEEDADATPV